MHECIKCANSTINAILLKTGKYCTVNDLLNYGLLQCFRGRLTELKAQVPPQRDSQLKRPLLHPSSCFSRSQNGWFLFFPPHSTGIMVLPVQTLLQTSSYNYSTVVKKNIKVKTPVSMCIYIHYNSRI